MTIAYEYTAVGDGETVDTSTYILHIPAYITVKSMDVVAITATKNDLEAGKKILVSIDWDKSYDADGSFNLYKSKGEVTEESMRCFVKFYTDGTLKVLQVADYYYPNNICYFAEFGAGSKSPTNGGICVLNQ